MEESQEVSEAEQRRLNSVLSHMSDGVLATDRRGNITIINETAQQLLDVNEDDNVIGKSLLDILGIRKDYTMRELVDDDVQQILIDNSDTSCLLYTSPSPRDS